MLNPFVWKKYGALILGMAITTCSFAVVTIFYGILWGVVAYLVTMLLMTVVGSLLLQNPFTAMLEGKGLLVLDINSTGIIRPFIVGVNNPYIQGKVGGGKVKDVFDRASIFQFAAPTNNKSSLMFEDVKKSDPVTPENSFIEPKVVIKLNEDEYNKGRFALFHYPVIIWNDQIKSIITKDMLSETEKDVFAEHTVLYLNRVMEDLTSLVRDFGRYIVELTKPQGSLGGKWWVWAIIIVGLVILTAMFAPAIINAVKGTVGTAATTVSNAGGAQIITPR